MKTQNLTTSEINQLAIKALVRELGPTAAVEFLQQFGRGKGNYTRDRHKWLDHLSVDDAFDSILRRQEQKKRGSAAKTTKRQRKRSA